MSQSLYQCLSCNFAYKWADVEPGFHRRCQDCDTWRCPACHAHQDSRRERPGVPPQTHRVTSEAELDRERRVEEMYWREMELSAFRDWIDSHGKR